MRWEAVAYNMAGRGVADKAARLAKGGVVMRHIDADEFFENFLISAVAAILGIRVFLHVAGYPTVGGESLHVAHMLWGGVLMLVALLMVLGYLGKPMKSAASVIGGLGWGTFIDELGKFLTHDNNYFFEPTFALIYVTFVLMYVVWERLHRTRLTGQEALANALELMLEAVRKDMDEEERRRAQELLAACDPADPVVRKLAQAIGEVELVERSRPGLLYRLRHFVRAQYARLVRHRWFATGVIAFFVAHSLNAVLQSIALVSQLTLPLLLFAAGLVVSAVLLRPVPGAGGVEGPGGREGPPRTPLAAAVMAVALVVAVLAARPVLRDLSPFQWAEVVATVIPALVVLLGVVRMRRSRLEAYRTFKTAILIIIFVTQFFAFYHQQLLAVFGLGVNILVWLTVRHTIHLEQQHARTGGSGRALATTSG
jgi:hypothetical protein